MALSHRSPNPKSIAVAGSGVFGICTRKFCPGVSQIIHELIPLLGLTATAHSESLSSLLVEFLYNSCSFSTPFTNLPLYPSRASKVSHIAICVIAFSVSVPSLSLRNQLAYQTASFNCSVF